jgi:hypothetical protein
MLRYSKLLVLVSGPAECNSQSGESIPRYWTLRPSPSPSSATVQHQQHSLKPLWASLPFTQNTSGMALSDGHPRITTKDGSRHAFSTQGSPVLRDNPLPGGDDHSLTPPPVPSANPISSARSESLPSPYPSGSVSSLLASTTTLGASSSSRT